MSQRPPGIVATSPKRVIGRYALFGELAAGGMAVVHLGRLLGPVGFARTVAIKHLHPQFASNPEFVAMFLDEARLAARIRHPNVVATLDVVVESNEIFLVMDYVQGESIARLLRAAAKRGESVAPAMAVNITLGVLAGLHAAHEATTEQGTPLGLVHRDVSPQNVMVGVDGAARVLDFGIAKAVGRTQLTREGELKGKISYMAPEQIKGGAVDRRADVYAAAVVLWEALTLRRLFVGANDAESMYQVLQCAVPPPSTIAAGIPPALDAIVMRGLAHNPEDRYATALEMALALERTVPILTAREVGAWVRDLAGDALAQRENQLEVVERDLTPEIAMPAAEPLGSLPIGTSIEIPDATTHLMVPAPHRPAKATSRWLLRASVVLGVACLLEVGGLLLWRLRPDPAVAIAAAPEAPSAATPSRVETSSAPTVDPSASPSASSAVSMSASPPASAAPSTTASASSPRRVVAQPQPQSSPSLQHRSLYKRE